MVKTELEEGEAHLTMENYQSFDVDEAFSYLDKKIENLLGHYRKEFDGGCSAGTLGAIHGGYGSFLPTYLRSPPPPPPCSQPKASPQVQNHSIQKISHLRNTADSVSETPVKREPASSCVPPVPVSNTSSVDNSVKVFGPTQLVSNHKTVKLPIKQFDQRNLKIRIKVGSDNSTLVKRNAAIYNTLGLDISPSSSLEDRPAELEGNAQDSQKRGGESPSRIIKIMTSFPILKGDLLSPLPDNMVHLVEEKKPIDRTCRPTQERVAASINEVASVNEVKEVLREKNVKPFNKNERLGELKKEHYKDSADPGIAYFVKESKSETLIGKKIVPDALKLLLKSSRSNKVCDSTDSPGKASDCDTGGAKDRIVSSNFKKEAVRSVFSQQPTSKPTAETKLVGKVQKETKGRHSLKSDLKINNVTNGAKMSESDSFIEDFGLHKATRDSSCGIMDFPNRNFQQKIQSHLDGGIKLKSEMQQPSSGVEKKFKGDRSSFSAGTSKEIAKLGSFAAPKDKGAHGSFHPSKSKGEGRLHKDLGKKETHNDLIGSAKFEKKGSKPDFSGTPCKDKAKNMKLEVPEKESVSFGFKSKKKSGGLVKPRKDTNNTTTSIDPLAANVAPVVNSTEDNWVACDNCGKWRLLPYDTNMEHLPKKWQCSMITWLPGMNWCNISEEETTNAFYALYQVPISNNQTSQQIYPEINAYGVALTNAPDFDQNTGDGQKILGINVQSAARHSDSMRILNTAKKKPEDLVKSETLLNASQSSLELKIERISGTARPSKKAKIDSMPYADEDQKLERLSRKEIEINNKQYSENSSSKDTRGMGKDDSVPTIGKSKKQALPTMAIEQHGKITIPGKKRKIKDWMDSQTCSVKETSETGCRKGKKAASILNQVMESNTCEDYGPDTRRKVNRNLLSVNIGNLGESKSSERDRFLGIKDRNKLSQLVVDKRSSKKNSGKEKPHVAATSSSSMIPGTCKVKLSLKEVRGSPVESNSSSTMRTLNPDNLTNCPMQFLASHKEKDNSSRAESKALHESTDLFFEGALKFFHGASLKDPCNSDGAKYGEMIAAELYYKAAQQFKYCALEYEKYQDMASASLAYKCMEVSYMRVILSSDSNASSDRNKLQEGVVVVSPAESPSSSASDVDNLNNQAIGNKMNRAKDVDSPKMTGNLIIAASSRPKFESLLNFAHHVNLAMEASKKSQIAFAAAELVLSEAGNLEGVSSIKRVLDFSFHDVQGLLALVRLAMDALKS